MGDCSVRLTFNFGIGWKENLTAASKEMCLTIEKCFHWKEKRTLDLLLGVCVLPPAEE